MVRRHRALQRGPKAIRLRHGSLHQDDVENDNFDTGRGFWRGLLPDLGSERLLADEEEIKSSFGVYGEGNEGERECEGDPGEVRESEGYDSRESKVDHTRDSRHEGSALGCWEREEVSPGHDGHGQHNEGGH